MLARIIHPVALLNIASVMDLFPHICPKQGWSIRTKLLVVTVPLVVIMTGVTAWAVAQEARRDLLLAVAGGAGLCLLIVGIVAVGTGLMVTRPLSRLAGRMRLFARIGEGPSTQAYSLPTGDEVVQLEKTFEGMVEVISHQQNQLSEANASLEERVVERTQALQSLVEAARQLTAEVNLKCLLQRIVETSQNLTKATHAALAVFDETEERLTRFVTVGMDEATAIELLSTKEDLLWLLAREKGGLRLKDFAQHPAFFDFHSHPPAMRSFLGVSIRAHRRLFGWLYLALKRGADEFTELDEQMITGLAAHAGVVIETAQLVSEVQGREELLRIKTNQLQAITDAMAGFLESGDWRASSGLLLRNALAQTDSGCGFIGVVIEGPVLRILAHEGIVWDSVVNRECYEKALCAYQERGYLEFANFDNLFGRVITTGHAVLSNEPGTDSRAGGVPSGHPPLRDFLGVPILSDTNVVGMIGVANRPGGYTGAERAQIDILSQAASVLYDNYRRRQHEAILEEQICQSQKMEAVGRLADGIAHDFNNLLTVITGSSQFLLRDLDPKQPLYEEAKEIQKAAERAASLTQQLLIFSRKQTLQLHTLDLNEVITDLAPMLQRLGEDIHLALALTPDHCQVMADSTRLEQVILNLAINARDAMPEGGTLTLETHIIELDEAHVVTCPGSKPGAYVLLAVSDSGMGMDAETQAHCFEPFFTTKPRGQGTGLGLATVYSIVKQSDGAISVDSEPGQGTTFKIFLPRVDPSSNFTGPMNQ